MIKRFLKKVFRKKEEEPLDLDFDVEVELDEGAEIIRVRW